MLTPTDHSIPNILPKPVGTGMKRRRSGRQAGMALVQVIIAVGVIAIAGAAGLRALIELNRKAATLRTMNQARAIVQRNIDSAMGVPFNTTLTPAVLAFTTSSGSIYDDDGNGDNLENILVGRSGNALVRGSLTRTVLAEANSDNADIRRVTFSLTYTFRGKSYTYAMTTLRTMD